MLTVTSENKKNQPPNQTKQPANNCGETPLDVFKLCLPLTSGLQWVGFYPRAPHTLCTLSREIVNHNQDREAILNRNKVKQPRFQIKEITSDSPFHCIKPEELREKSSELTKCIGILKLSVW